MFFKKPDRASATEYAVVEKSFFTSNGTSASGEGVLNDAIPPIQSDENTSNEQQIDVCKIASYSERCKLSATRKLQISINRNTLPPSFLFPDRLEKCGCQRHFQAKWLQHYSRLEYSVMANTGFCVPCMLFGIDSDNIDLSVLVSRPLTNFKKTIDELKAHNEKASRLDAVTGADVFLKVMSGQQGHDDSTKTIEAQPTSNLGNFKALLQFRVDAGDKDLEFHMKTAPKNTTCCSATIQNEIIDVISTLIREHIVERVKKCRCYSVIADEVTNSVNTEQLSLVICYFDPESKTVAERLLDFTSCQLGVTGHAIAATILDLFQKNHLDPKLLRGQGYDGNSNMARKSKEQQ